MGATCSAYRLLLNVKTIGLSTKFFTRCRSVLVSMTLLTTFDHIPYKNLVHNGGTSILRTSATIT